MPSIEESQAIERLTSPARDSRLPAYLGDNRLLISLNSGQSFVVDTVSLDLSAALIRSGLWEPWVVNHLAKFVLRHGDPVIVDVGAHVGYFPVVLGGLAASRRVWAFEPNARLFDLLTTNLFINGISRDGARQLALSSTPGKLVLRYKRGETGGGHVDFGAPIPGFEGQEVEVQTLDAVLPRNLVVDLLKIDVEGYEPQVLLGARQTIARSPGILICIEATPEAWKTHGYNASEIFGALAKQGFQLRLATAEGLVELETDKLVERVKTLGYITCVLACRDWSMMDAPAAPVGLGTKLKRKLRSGLRRLRSAMA